MIEFIAKCGCKYDVDPINGFVETEPCKGEKKFELDEEYLNSKDPWIEWICPKCKTRRDVVTMYRNSIR